MFWRIDPLRGKVRNTGCQQYRSGVFCGPRGDRYYATRDARRQQYRNYVYCDFVRPEAV
jgi:hypothetical protein